ncbi:MAG TPA: histidine--tRNA ligase [Nitrososphaera sp.]|nr:histidine--tRNA ligase [Nitrososphaera sp.]
MVKLEIPRGMRDVEPAEFSALSFIRDKFFETATSFNFRLMDPSPLELLSTLEAKSGESISKEIYSFKDKGEREVALRFDLTIGLTRYVALRRDLKMPAKLASFAGVWRYDEPQAGRYRYFHQWDVEVYGPFSQESDAEVIAFVSAFFKRLGLKVTIEVNDRQLIEQYINKTLEITDSEKVLELFRAVDKVPKKGPNAVLQEYSGMVDPSKLKRLIELSGVRGSVAEVAENADVRNLEAWARLSGLMESLAARGVEDVFVNLGIVRGLDYYSGIVFEAFEKGVKGGALVGGGRYDRLTAAFGRNDIGATGVAGGVERIALALQRQGVVAKGTVPLVYIAYAADEMKRHVLEIVSSLRNVGLAADYDLIGRALRKQLDDAAGKNAKAVVIVAPEEYATGTVIVKILESGKEERYPLDRLHAGLLALLKA